MSTLSTKNLSKTTIINLRSSLIMRVHNQENVINGIVKARMFLQQEFFVNGRIINLWRRSI